MKGFMRFRGRVYAIFLALDEERFVMRESSGRDLRGDLTMTDTVDRKKRSEIMSRVGSRDTKPELIVRRIAHRLGFRFRLHRKDLPGCPDIVFPKYQSVIFVHGCFWHRHPSCKYASSPKTHVEYWENKFQSNVARDMRNEVLLHNLGWRTMVIWECEIKDRRGVARRISSYLRQTSVSAERLKG